MISVNVKASYIDTLVLQITTVDNRLLAIKPPTIIPRLPRSIKDYLTWKGTFFFFLYGPYISNYYSVIYFFKWFNYLDYSCSFGYLLSKSTQFCSLNWLIKLLVSYVIKVFYVHVNRQVRSGLSSPPTI